MSWLTGIKMVNQKKTNHKVLCINQFFPHYRQSVITQLIEKSEHHYDFMGGKHSFGMGIQLATNIPADRFKVARGFVFWRFLFWPRPVLAALNPRYDVLILLGNPRIGSMWLTALFGKLTGKRVLFWTHGWKCKEAGFKRFCKNTFFKLADGLLLYGHRAKVIGVEEGFNPDHLYVVYNSLDCKAQDKVRSKILSEDRAEMREELFGEQNMNPVIINITRLHQYKKIDMLIEAAVELKKKSVFVNLLILGDGPHRGELEELAERNGIHAVFTGAIYDENKIGRMLDASDLAVMPGPVGLLVMHALAYGVPVVSNNNFDTQMPEFEAITPGITGDFFEPDNLNSLVDSIQRVLNNPMPKEQQYQKARERIERFYNPVSQRMRIDSAVEGNAANDLMKTFPYF